MTSHTYHFLLVFNRTYAFTLFLFFFFWYIRIWNIWVVLKLTFQSHSLSDRMTVWLFAIWFHTNTTATYNTSICPKSAPLQNLLVKLQSTSCLEYDLSLSLMVKPNGASHFKTIALNDPKYHWILQGQMYLIYFTSATKVQHFNPFSPKTIHFWDTGHFETSAPLDSDIWP